MSAETLAKKAPLAALALTAAIAAALLLAITHELTYFQDTWSFLMNRRELTLDTLLKPHNEHIFALPVVVEVVCLRLFGMDSATPEYVVLTALLVATAVVLFVYVRRRIGPWAALIAAALLLFLGPAWQDIIWPFEIGFIGSVLCGIGMLLALERRDRLGDGAACALIVASIAFSSLGVAFIAGAVADVLLRGRARGWGRAYVPIVPILLYLGWYVGWGHVGETHLSLHNILSSPQFVAEGFAASLESLFGLSAVPVEGPGEITWGRPLFVTAVILVVYGQLRRPGFPTSLLVVAASAGAYWTLAAFNYIPGREPYTSRYIYAGAVFVLLLAAELLRGARLDRRALLAVGAVAGLAIVSNLAVLKEGKEWLARQTVYTKANLAGIEIARRTVSPDFRLSPELADTPSLVDITAGQYLEAVREYGSPAYTASELADAPEYGRAQADVLTAHALPLVIAPARGGGAASACDTFQPGEAAALPGLRLPRGRTVIRVAPGPDAGLRLRRFAEESFPVTTEGAPGGAATMVRIPRDTVARPWYLQVEAQQAVTVCRQGDRKAAG